MDYCSIKVTFLAFLPDTRRTFPPESDLTPLLTPPETVFRWGGVWFIRWVRTGGGVDGVVVVCQS